ncbi:MAG TPA: YdhR family protein, partial [Miltoncostaeaceae bacterium]|nr:YdhR family protein [Miltoncostaeaceae bacterium]
IVTFSLADLGDEDFRDTAAQVAPAFSAVPGLSAKLWLADDGSGTYGGVYLFESAGAAEAYLSSELFAEAVLENPHLADVAIRRADVLADATAHTARDLRLPAAAAPA